MNQDENMNNGKYEEALERATELHESGNALTKQQMEIVFPELKEGEDERIRKFLVKHVSEWIGCIEHDLKLSSKDVESEEELAMFKACLSYLERQKDLAAIPNELVKNYKLFCEQGGRELALLINAINGFNKLKEQQPVECNEHEGIRHMIENTLRDSVISERISETSYREMLAYLERRKEHKLPEPEYGGENKQYPTEYRMDQDTRKKLIALVEKFGQEEDKDEMLDYLESYQPVQSASEIKEFNFQPGDPDEKAIKRLKAMIYFAFDETSEVPMDEACALDDWLDDKCKPAVLEEQKPAEWGKEDEEKLSAVISLMKSSRAVNPFYDKMCLEGWLKSLRPKPHWKPSEYTLSLVKKVANGEMLTHMEQMAMETLCNDLKKLL